MKQSRAEDDRIRSRINAVFTKKRIHNMVIFILASCWLFMVIFFVTQRMITDEVNHLETLRINKIATQTDEVLSQILKIVVYCGSLSFSEAETEYEMMKVNEIKNNISFFISAYDYISAISIKYNDQQMVVGTALEIEGKPLMNIGTVSVEITEDEYLSYLIFNYSPTNYCNVKIHVKTDAIGENVFYDLRSSQKYECILSNQDEVIITNDYQLRKRLDLEWTELNITAYSDGFHKINFNGKTYYLCVKQMANGLKALTFTPYYAYSDLISGKLISMLLLIAFTIALFAVVLYVVNRQAGKPIKDIVAELQKHFPKPLNGMDEVEYVNNNIKDTLSAMNNINNKLLLKTESLKKLQISALQSQINSHFIYNALDAFNWMSISKMGVGNPVSVGLIDMSYILHESLSCDGVFHTIEKEISILQKYIDIMSMRYRDRFTTEIYVPEQLKKCNIVKFCLQPLVENAILHGFVEPDVRGCISIVFSVHEEVVTLKVTDNGAGTEAWTLAEIQSHISDDSLSEGNHIGLRNIHKRIQLLYGEKYGLSVKSELCLGTECTLCFPEKYTV